MQTHSHSTSYSALAVPTLLGVVDTQCHADCSFSLRREIARPLVPQLQKLLSCQIPGTKAIFAVETKNREEMGNLAHISDSLLFIADNATTCEPEH